ncbi:uncharacterized protein [Antedon mediterranea]|uniref:uncharacterized protein n=1 Tax=Antedon mediterranea TaxID=105859 RepID=UPI003AF5DB8C
MEERGCFRNCLVWLRLTNEHPTLFTKSQFTGLNPYIFTVYRFVVTLYLTAFACWYTAASAPEYGWTYLVYLTNLTLLLVVFYLIASSINSTIVLIRRCRHTTEEVVSSSSSGTIDGNNALPFIYKIQWFLYNMATASSLLVVLIYWGAIYTPDTDVTIFTDLNIHGLTILVMAIETLVSAVPVRMSHGIYPLAYGVFYVILTVIFWAAGGTDPNGNAYIYSIIDYEENADFAVIVVIGALIGIIVCHVVMWLLFKLRMKVVTKWFEDDTRDEETEGEQVATSGV